jgi:hypothetical protein
VRKNRSIQPVPSGWRTSAGDKIMPRKVISAWKSALIYGANVAQQRGVVHDEGPPRQRPHLQHPGHPVRRVEGEVRRLIASTSTSPKGRWLQVANLLFEQFFVGRQVRDHARQPK